MNEKTVESLKECISILGKLLEDEETKDEEERKRKEAEEAKAEEERKRMKAEKEKETKKDDILS